MSSSESARVPPTPHARALTLPFAALLAVAVSALPAGPAGAARLPSTATGAPVVLDRGSAGQLDDPRSAVDRAGTTYIAWANAGVARLCVLPAAAARCSRTTVLPDLRGAGFQPVLGIAGTVTLVGDAPDTTGDTLVAATSTDGGTSFAAARALAPLPLGSRLLSVASVDGSILAAAVSPAGVTVRAVRLDQDTPATGDGAVFPLAARDAHVAHSSTGPVLVVRLAGRPPQFTRYAGEGTADDVTGWTPLRSFAGNDDGAALLAVGDDPVLLSRSGAGRRLQAARWTGTSFARAIAVDSGSSGAVAAGSDPTGRLTVVRGGGSAAGLVASSTARGAYRADAPPPTFSDPVRVLAVRPAAGSVAAVSVSADGSGVVVARTATATESALILQRFLTPAPAVPPR